MLHTKCNFGLWGPQNQSFILISAITKEDQMHGNIFNNVIYSLFLPLSPVLGRHPNLVLWYSIVVTLGLVHGNFIHKRPFINYMSLALTSCRSSLISICGDEEPKEKKRESLPDKDESLYNYI